MDYTTVFDATQAPFRNLGFAAFGLIFVALGALLVFAPKVLDRFGMKPRRGMAAFAWLYFLFSVAITGIAGTAIVYGDFSARRSLRNGTCEVLEGPVRQFQPMPYGGHQSESFEVDGSRFEYSDYEVSAGFNNTASHGGPIREGLPVRICHRAGKILRLEVGSARTGA